MIKLDVEGYCHECLDFCPDVIKPERVIAPSTDAYYTDTIIKCKYRKRCGGIMRFLENQTKEKKLNE